MKVFLAGAGGDTYPHLCEKYKMQKLYSALNERRRIQEYPTRSPLMVDSGAHSWNKTSINPGGGHAKTALPPLDQWMETLTKLYLSWDMPSRLLVELDVYAEAPLAAIDEMAEAVRSKLKYATFVRVYHPMIDAGSCRVLKQWIDQGYTYLGVGMDAAPVWGKVFKLTRDKIRLHGFAATKEDLLFKYPFFSVDSSTAIAAARYGGGYGATGKYRGKDRLIKEKSVQLVRPNLHAAIEDGVRAMKALQDRVTKFWEAKGIVWPDLPT